MPFPFDDGIVVLEVGRRKMSWTNMVVTDRFECRLVEETSKLRVEIAGVRQEISSLRLGLADDRFELLKWAFIFWVGQLFAVVTVMLVLIRFLKPGS